MSDEGAERRPRRRLSPRARRTLLTAHILVSVGLFGDVAGFLAVAIRAAGTEDPEVARASYDILAMFSTFLGIPLSFAALLTGIGLGLGTKWGVLRYPWTTAKLVLLVTVILMGAFVLGPSVEQMRDGSGGTEGRILVGGGWDLAALATATVLAVFKPGGARGSKRGRMPSQRKALTGAG
ncbi:MAG: DUF2269 family protein [Solirubrobacterales bacterium]